MEKKLDTPAVETEAPQTEAPSADIPPSEQSPQRTGIADLIWRAKNFPSKPVITGLLHEKEIAGLHGAPEVFKTIFTLQLAESLATGKPFLGVWPVPKPRRVYFFETEMSETMLGSRLAKMYADVPAPESIYFASEAQLKAFCSKKAPKLEDKFFLLKDWLSEAKAEVVVLDTANPFFRGQQSPNDETTAGEFFDLLAALPTKTKIFVRHNRKPKMDDSGDAITKIRGSGQFSDVPDLLLELSRPDKRTNEAVLSISKYRHGSKAEPLTLWLDTGNLRLVSIPPVIHLLQDGPLTRRQLLAALDERFGVKQTKAETKADGGLIREVQPYVVERMGGHERLFELDWEAAREADWYPWLESRSRGRDRETQGCVSSSLSPRESLFSHRSVPEISPKQ